MKKTHLFLLTALTGTLIFTGCLRTKTFESRAPGKTTPLVVYGLYDSPDVYKDVIASFEQKNRGADVIYKRFNDPQKYWDLILNELAEGEGPDIFMMHNSWISTHHKKILPAPESIANPELFEEFFVDVAYNDLVFPDDEGVLQVWGLPMDVDTLALYYNNEHIEEVLPDLGRPSTTWAGIAANALQLNREDNSVSRFERSGIAMGRLDNVTQGFELLLTLFLQRDVPIYTEDYLSVGLRNNTEAIEALQFFTSFATPSQQNYSWNEFISDPGSAEKELAAFARGELSMLPGFSFTYEAILDEINHQKQLGNSTIQTSDIQIAEIPQWENPQSSPEARDTLASYFVPTVARTTQNPELAWDFMAHLVQEDSLRSIHEQSHRPSARRSLINEQRLDPIYGVFAQQIGYAKSIPMPSPNEFEQAFELTVNEIVGRRVSARDGLADIAEDIQALIPEDGVKPQLIE